MRYKVNGFEEFGFQQYQKALILLGVFFCQFCGIMSFTSTIRPKTTSLNNRSFMLDKRSTISTRQTCRSPAKSFIAKSSTLTSTQKMPKLQTMGQSVPVQIYFNPSFKNNYVKKVIDSFFVNFQAKEKTNNPQNMKKSRNDSRLCLRSRMKEWKQRSKLSSDLGFNQSNKFIRSSPNNKKSIFSELQQNKSLAIISESNLPKPLEKDLVQQSQLMQSFQSFEVKQTSLEFRPFSEHSPKKRRARDSSQDSLNNISKVSVSVFFNQSNSPREKLRKQNRKLIEANSYFQQFKVFQQGKLTHKLRKYLNKDNPMYLRQQKLHKRGLPLLWNPSKFPQSLIYPLAKPISHLLCQQFTYGHTQLDMYRQIYPQKYYQELFLNKNEELVDLIRAMVKFIANNKGKVLSNSFMVGNLYKINEKEFYLKDLGKCGLVEEITIRDRCIRHLYQPLVREEGRWVVRPEYLSPEMIDSVKNMDYAWIQNNPQAVIGSEIWSLGLMILEILTLIPLNSDIRTRVKTNPDILRRGFLSIQFKENHVDLELLQRKQKYLQTILHKRLETQLKNVAIEKRVISVLKKMLVYEAGKRITPKEILDQLKF